jgi:hypothetical protein
VPLKTYDESVAVLRRSLEAAKMGDDDKLQGLARLDRFVRAVERNCETEVDFAGAIAHGNAISPELGGRSVFDDRKPRRSGKREPRQMDLFS